MSSVDEILDGFEQAILCEGPLATAALAGGAFGLGLKLGGLSAVKRKAQLAYAPPPRHEISSVDKDPLAAAYLDAVSEAVILIWDAFHQANEVLEQFDIQYQLPRHTPELRKLSTGAPNMFELNVVMRDNLMERRKPQSVRLRISKRTASATISISSLDPKLPLSPNKHVVRLDPRQRTFQLKSFQEQLIPALIQRARRAYRR